MSRWKLGSMVSKWVFSPTYKWGIPWGYNPLILTIDPKFQRDIQVPLDSHDSSDWPLLPPAVDPPRCKMDIPPCQPQKKHQSQKYVCS